MAAVSTGAVAREFRAGAIDLNRSNAALTGSFIIPSMNALAMPFLFHSVGQLQKWKDIEAQSRRQAEDAGVAADRTNPQGRVTPWLE